MYFECTTVYVYAHHAALEHRGHALQMAAFATYPAVGIVNDRFRMACVAGQAGHTLLLIVRITGRIFVTGQAVHILMGHD